jgi:hypothetical protein
VDGGVVVTRVEETVGGLVETVPERVVMTFIVVVTHLVYLGVPGRSVYGCFDLDACILAGLRVATFKGIDDGWCVRTEFSLVTMTMTVWELHVKLCFLNLLGEPLFGFAVAKEKQTES